ncbi:MAG: signal recognition particle-docking protein FtsY [Euryarchaeota archaeon]|nr:signal recognition particle-docking protein FtsY [Euryarchaeota archaeon]MDE1881439.1 signal recognition particle-docking protein FtsY [Euryarchaeota archaeon]MDE2046320.1 signal recognition particle-docking protein FtsY [Thermoplasmata archaeon]
MPPPSPEDVEDYFTDGFGFRIKETKIKEILQQLEIVLLESDVALEVAEGIRRAVRKYLTEQKLRLGQDPAEAVEAALKSAVKGILAQPPIDLEKLFRAGPKPFIILFIGVNGSGKTTSIAKLASLLRKQGLGVVLAAGDTFRAGAIEQLAVHGERLGVRVVRQGEGSDPAAVAFDAVAHAKSRGLDVVLVDTAGRQHTNINLVEEAKKIRRVVNPHLTLFVGDALNGNDMVEQARMFQKELGFDGTILTKLDTDTKGGSALSVTYVVHKPILFVGLGQGYDDLRPFDPDWMVARLFSPSKEARE